MPDFVISSCGMRVDADVAEASKLTACGECEDSLSLSDPGSGLIDAAEFVEHIDETLP